MQRANFGAAPRARVVVLRTRRPECLGVLRERALNDALVLPAGNYGFSYAAALELARLLHHNEQPPNLDARGLSRAALADSLRALALERRAIVVPRLDWLDAPSAALFHDLLRMAAVAQSGLHLIGGLPAAAAPPGLEGLLNDAQFADETFDPLRARALTAPERALLAALRAAPMPLEPNTLMRISGLRARDFDAALRKLAACGYADIGPRIGKGAASEILPPVELARFHEAALEECALPDARVALLHALGLAGREAAQLAADALRQGEAELALARLRFVPAQQRDAAAYALALARCGRLEPALALFDTLRAPDLPRARLAFELCRQGALNLAAAQACLRAVERAQRGQAGELEAATLRAHLLRREGRSRSALKLLRRITASQAEAAPADIRARYLLELSRAWQAAGKPRKAAAVRACAQGLSVAPALELEIALESVELGASHKARVAAAAARTLDADAAARAVKGCAPAQRALMQALGVRAAMPEPAAPQSFEEWFALFSRHGATLLATLEDDRLRVLPARALARADLCAWLQAQLEMASRGGGLLVQCRRLEGEFAADCVLLLPATEMGGPLVALFARPADPAPLLKLASAANTVRRWLAFGVLKAEELKTLLAAADGEDTPWTTSQPRSHPSNAPLTSL